MFDIVSDAWIIAVLQIIAIDIVLGGDNAIIIALACRNLPKIRNALAFYGVPRAPLFCGLFWFSLPQL